MREAAACGAARRVFNHGFEGIVEGKFQRVSRDDAEHVGTVALRAYVLFLCSLVAHASLSSPPPPTMRASAL